MARVVAQAVQVAQAEPELAGPVVRAEPVAQEVQEVQAQEVRGPAAKGPAAKEVLPEKLWLPLLAEQVLSVLQMSPQPFR